jgi:hypothetical protein
MDGRYLVRLHGKIITGVHNTERTAAQLEEVIRDALDLEDIIQGTLPLEMYVWGDVVGHLPRAIYRWKCVLQAVFLFSQLCRFSCVDLHPACTSHGVLFASPANWDESSN